MAGLSAHVPIAGLSPELDAQSSKSVKAIVTLTWPYSSATGSVAFLLAEPDFRLRRSKGQVRVQFSGSSARRIAKSGIASGDELIISLDGVEWLRNASIPATPGTGVDFELKFTERLLLQFTPEGSETEELIDIDHPPPEPEQDAVPNREITPEPPSPESNKLPKQRDIVLKNGDEWSSPAFIKRARTSYGSLFDTGYDPFAEEDGTIPGKGRKKSRLSSTWRYVSRSPSPEPDAESIPASSPTAAAAAAPAIADEGSQPVSLGDTDAAETLAHFSREAGSRLRNAEASTKGDGHVSFSAESPLIGVTEMQPPATIRPSLNTTDATQQFSLQQSTPTQAPSSPRLQPVPSDALPLVSPLVTSQSSPFKANGEATPALDDQPTNLIFQQSLEHAENTPIDQFAAPSAAHHEDEHIPLSTFQERDTQSHELDGTGFEGSFDPHDPFGHWSSNTAPELLGHGAEQGQEFYVGEIVESGAVTQRFDRNLEGPPAPHSNVPSYPQYEPLDAQLHGHDLDALFAPGPSPVAYPELPEHAAETTHIETHGLSPSADKAPVVKDTTSGVVDLTESDEDEDDQGISERSLDDRGGEGSIEGEEVEEEDDEDELMGSQTSKFDTDGWRPAYPGQDGMEPEDYEGYSEEDEGDDRYDREEDFSDDDGEGEEYDEDEMEDDAPQKPSAPKEPVVIDLLSSDDEDNAEPAAPAPRAVTSRQKPATLEEESESEEEEESLEEVDEEMDDVQNVGAEKGAPSPHRNGLPTITQHEDALAPADEHADDESADEEFEDAREEDTQPGKENIPDAPEETSAIPALKKATNGSTNDTNIPTDKPSRRRLPEDLGYNLDGANDNVGASSKRTALRRRSRDLKAKSQGVIIDQPRPPLQDSIQLPTPDATQVSVAKDSQGEPAAAEAVPSMIDDSQASTTAEAVNATQEKADDTVVEGEVKPSEVTVAADESAEAKAKEAEHDRSEAETSTRRTSARLSHDHHKSEAQADHHVEDPQKENPPSPRRSRRIRHASGSAAQIAEIMRPSTPDDARAGEIDENSPAAPNSLSKQWDQDPSVEMAMSALKSSPEAHHDLRSTSVVDLKLSLSRALRTDLSEFTALKVLRFHINQKLDVFGIVTSTPGEPQRTKGGPRHYQVTFNITDSSVAPSGVTEVQVFRPYSEALPVVQDGNGILLRNFQVIAIKNRGFALRSEQNEACSWAVFKDGVAEPEVRGPPVEYGEGEKKHMAAMKEWYGTLDAASVAKLQRANEDKGGVGKGAGKAS